MNIAGIIYLCLQNILEELVSVAYSDFEQIRVEGSVPWAMGYI